jgi:hypothetical protein
VKLKCIALAVAAFVLPFTLLQGAKISLGELIRGDIRTSCDTLLDNWLAAGASCPDASQPLFQAATEQLLAIRVRASAAIGNSKVVVLDKARLVERGDIRSRKRVRLWALGSRKRVRLWALVQIVSSSSATRKVQPSGTSRASRCASGRSPCFLPPAAQARLPVVRSGEIGNT